MLTSTGYQAQNDIADVRTFSRYNVYHVHRETQFTAEADGIQFSRCLVKHHKCWIDWNLDLMMVLRRWVDKFITKAISIQPETISVACPHPWTRPVGVYQWQVYRTFVVTVTITNTRLTLWNSNNLVSFRHKYFLVKFRKRLWFGFK